MAEPLPLSIRTTRTDVLEPALSPEIFTADTADIYTNTLCGGAGTVEESRLCDYCFLSTQQLKNPTMMDMATFDKILDWNSSEGSSVKTLSLLGGEFPLNPNAKDMLLRAYERGFNIHVVTNGSAEFKDLIADREVRDVLCDPERDNLVAVSLDSIESTVNDMYRGRGAAINAIQTITRLSHPSYDIPYRINVTVMRAAIEGLSRVFAFGEEMGARAVLVHFPSSVGRGRSTFGLRKAPQYSGNGESLNPVPTLGEWSRLVVGQIVDYKRNRRQRSDFDISCERGYLGSDMSRQEQKRCDMATGSSSLQFAPRISSDNLDIPVVACGLNMAKASTYSAYILREGKLYERAGKSELHDAAYGDKVIGCPLTNSGKDNRQLSCIYSRTEE